MDAARALLVQNLLLTWRYSIGNPYEQFSFPEGVDVAQVLGEQGFEDVARAILRTSLTRPDDAVPELEDGREAARLGDALPPLPRPRLPRRARRRSSAATSRRSAARSTRAATRPARPRALLVRHPRPGLRPALADRRLGGAARDGRRVGSRRARRALAATCRRLAARLEAGLRRAVRESQRRLPDGSLLRPGAPARRRGGRTTR